MKNAELDSFIGKFVKVAFDNGEEKVGELSWAKNIVGGGLEVNKYFLYMKDECFYYFDSEEVESVETVKIELKPCPICGGRPRIIQMYDVVMIECTNNNHLVKTSGKHINEAVWWWNWRKWR